MSLNEAINGIMRQLMRQLSDSHVQSDSCDEHIKEKPNDTVRYRTIKIKKQLEVKKNETKKGSWTIKSVRHIP